MRDAPVTIEPALVREIWTTVEDLRDQVSQLKAEEGRLNDLLKRMQAAGLADWLPTLEEVRADGPYFLNRD